MRNYYKVGECNVTCDVCSKKIKSGIAKQRWDGFITCPSCFETRHPQDFIRAKQDKITVPFTRPIPPIIFVPTPDYHYWDNGYTLDGYVDGDTI